MEKTLNVIRKLMCVLGALFCFELVFGYTGTMLVIGGVALRHILFIPTFLLAYLYCLLYLIQNRIPLFKSSAEQPSICRSLKLLDWLMLAFILSTAISIFVVPRLFGGSFQFAKAEALDSLMMLVFYFPVRFMIRWGEFSLDRMEKYIYWLVFGLAVLHIVLYIGQSFNSHFIEGYFDILKTLSGGTAQTPPIILGHGGYPRVMYTTSLYLLVGMFLVLKKLKQLRIYDYVVFLIELVALLTTMTKSIWFGFLFGLLVFLVGCAIHIIREKQKDVLLRVGTLLVCSVLLVVTTDSLMFNHMVLSRMQNAFVTTPPVTSAGDDDTTENPGNTEQAGAALSNAIKIEQTEKLLAKWTGSPLIGYGYGSYVEEYLRSTECPFSYEMQFPALLMKTGIIGLGLLLAVVIAMVRQVMKQMRRRNSVFVYAWLFLLLAVVLCVQTNPLLLSFTGMSMVLLLLFESSRDEDVAVDREIQPVPAA